jgi:hypothetical protein
VRPAARRRSARAVVHFLEPDDVRLERAEDARRPLEVHHVVVAAAVADVVADDAERVSRLEGRDRCRRKDQRQE